LIGVDTNVLVRLFVVDDPGQSQTAGRFFASRSGADPVFVSLIVVAELVWLLDDTYDFALTAIVRVLEDLLSSPDFVLEYPEFIAQAVALAKQRKIDIADHLIAQVALTNGSRSIVTFDTNAAKRIPGMELLK
jgi:predicted nucleic-acid-binding protein